MKSLLTKVESGKGVIIALLLLFGFVATGCGTEPVDDLSKDCTKIEQIRVPDDKPVVTLVVDNTASATTGDLPPRILAELKQAQSRGESLALIAVDGAGRQATVVRKIALEPNPGKDSAAADRARPIVLDCVGRWARADVMRPSAPGSAVLDAIAVAARQNPSLLLVVSDGVNNIGQFDLDELGFDAAPGPLAAALASAGGLAPELEGRKIIWAGLGETGQSLAQPARTNLAAIWRTVLEKAKASVEFDQQMGKRGSTPDGLPADLVAIPEMKKLSLSCGVRRTIPAALLFGADSAALLPGAEQVLNVVASDMTARRELSALVEGHTADFGDESGKLRLSRERADAVVKALKHMGVGDERLESAGLGSSRLADAGTPDAAANRRVDITLGAKGCGR